MDQKVLYPIEVDAVKLTNLHFTHDCILWCELLVVNYLEVHDLYICLPIMHGVTIFSMIQYL